MMKVKAAPRPAGAGAKRRYIRARGKNAYVSPGDPGEGECTYCGRYGPRSNDHVLPRGTFPQHRNERRNLVPACWWCNQAREDTTWKPKWSRLPAATREWVLSVELPGRVARLFEGVPNGPVPTL